MVQPSSTAYQPALSEAGVLGSRCTSCERTAAPATPRCPWCGARSEDTSFPARGSVWSSTVVHIDVGARKPPYALAYVDLDGGPRVLTLLSRPEGLPHGTRVHLIPIEDPSAWAQAEEASA